MEVAVHNRGTVPKPLPRTLNEGVGASGSRHRALCTETPRPRDSGTRPRTQSWGVGRRGLNPGQFCPRGPRVTPPPRGACRVWGRPPCLPWPRPPRLCSGRKAASAAPGAEPTRHAVLPRRLREGQDSHAPLEGKHAGGGGHLPAAVCPQARTEATRRVPAASLRVFPDTPPLCADTSPAMAPLPWQEAPSSL